MKLHVMGANRTRITYADGTEVFYSYETPVAAFVPGRGYLVTEQFYSRTTSRHVTQYLPEGAKKTRVPQAELDALVKGAQS